MADILKIMGQYGGLNGILLLGTFLIIWKLWNHIKFQQEQLLRLQDVRVTESKEVRTELMKFSEDSNRALGEMSGAITSLKDALLLTKGHAGR